MALGPRATRTNNVATRQVVRRELVLMGLTPLSAGLAKPAAPMVVVSVVVHRSYNTQQETPSRCGHQSPVQR